jgi:hypothetical protein
MNRIYLFNKIKGTMKNENGAEFSAVMSMVMNGTLNLDDLDEFLLSHQENNQVPRLRVRNPQVEA